MKRIIITLVLVLCILYLYKSRQQKSDFIFDDSNLITVKNPVLSTAPDGVLKHWFYTKQEMDDYFSQYRIDYISKSMPNVVSSKWICIFFHQSTESYGANGRLGGTFAFYKEVSRRETPHTLLALTAIYFADLPSIVSINDEGGITVTALPK